MKVHEYQAKEIFSTYGIPVERHALCHTADGAVAAYHRMGVNRVAIKAQVLTGGRGKAGGVKLANNDRDVYQYAQTILEMTIKGYPVTKILLSEAVNIAAEYYISFTIDRNTRSVTLIMSAAGGMDIEEVARQSPEKIIRCSIDPLIGVPDYLAHKFAFSLFEQAEQANQMATIIQDLYKAFIEKMLHLLKLIHWYLPLLGHYWLLMPKWFLMIMHFIVIWTYRSYQSPQKMRSWKRLPKKEDSAMCAWTAR